MGVMDAILATIHEAEEKGGGKGLAVARCFRRSCTFSPFWRGKLWLPSSLLWPL